MCIDARLLTGGWDTSRSQPAGVQINTSTHGCICKAGLVLAPDGSPAATLRQPVRQSVHPSAHPSVRAGTKQLLIPSWADKTNPLRSKGRAGTLMCGTAPLRVTLHFKELHSSLRRQGRFRSFNKNVSFFVIFNMETWCLFNLQCNDWDLRAKVYLNNNCPFNHHRKRMVLELAVCVA